MIIVTGASGKLGRPPTPLWGVLESAISQAG